MTQKTAEEIRVALVKPFAPEDLEWRLQRGFEDQMRGIAVPYVTNRAIQNRLDEVVGPDGWYNEYKTWHSAGKKEAQICGISIFFEGRGFITKWDGAEDTDVEPVKGGLSDSMKRAAVQWGVGRVLYDMEPVWVHIEKKGKSLFIKDSERAKLDNEYLKMLKRLNLTPAAAGGTQAQLIPKEGKSDEKDAVPAAGGKTPASGLAASTPRAGESKHEQNAPAPLYGMTKITSAPKFDYIVSSAREQVGMNKEISTSLMLQDADGKRTLAFARGAYPELKVGVKLFNVKKTLKRQDNVAFYLLDSFEIAGENAA